MLQRRREACGSNDNDPPTSSRAKTTTVPPAPVAVAINQCPRSSPMYMSLINYYVRGLFKKEVPIRALSVRVCEYSFDGRLTDSSDVLGPIHAAHLADETNRLAAPSPGIGTACPSIPATFFVTFASQTQQVSVVSYHCGDVVNGAIVVQPTAKWFNEVDVDLFAGHCVGCGPTG